MDYCVVQMSVRVQMATSPRYFKCRYDMPSALVDPFDLVLPITVLVMLGVNGGEGSMRALMLLCVLSISLSVGSCGSRDTEE